MCPMSPLHTSLSEGHIEHCVRGTGTTVSSDTSISVELIELAECGDTEHSISPDQSVSSLTGTHQWVGDVSETLFPLFSADRLPFENSDGEASRCDPAVFRHHMVTSKFLVPKLETQ
ncbi:unnamed protein product [Gadus morhua 'NCC']